MLSPTKTAPSRRTRRLRTALTAILLMSLGTFIIPQTTASAADTELVPNAGFDAGAKGWVTNGSNQILTILDGGIAQLTTRSTGHATLNDRPNAVKNTAKGTNYTVTARVRTTTPSVNGSLRIREVAAAQATTSSQSFVLSNTSWQVVTLSVKTVYASSHLDLNVTAASLQPSKNLQIDWVSVKQGTVADNGTGALPAPVAPPASGTCDAPPPSGTIFGTSMSTSGQTFPDALKGLDSTFGKVNVIRHFSPGLPLSWSSRNAGLVKGRTMIMSFKRHPTEITSGKYDAFFRNWFKTAPNDQTIYWSYFHEPEGNINAGEFTLAQYRAAWIRLANLAKEACKPNLHATLILTGWTMNPSSKRDYRVYDAGPEYVKVLAFDPYNGIYEDRNYYEAPDLMFAHIVTKMKADGRPWGIAETGARLIKGDASGTKRAEWLTSMGPYLRQNKALFATYFHSTGTNGDYRLSDKPSQAAWSKLVKG